MIVVLADDLSGAAELAGIAVRHGLSAELQTDFFPDTGADVICVAADTRSLPAEHAAQTVAAITKEIVAAKPTWIFKKCDSVLRGPVLAETRTMVQAAGKTRSIILSANPSRGRIVRNGNYSINGQPLHETVFANDPEHPRTTSRVADLLGADLAGIETPDVETSADMLHLAASVEVDTLPVGAADFFEALLQLRILPRGAFLQPASVSIGTTLLVCGSAAAWAQRRTEALAVGFPVLALPHEVAAAVQALNQFDRVLIGIGDDPAAQGHAPAILVRQLAVTVAEILRETLVSRLLLEGGATAAAIVQALGWTRLRACNFPFQGVGVVQPVNSPGPILFIKPGSYSWSKEIWPCVAAER